MENVIIISVLVLILRGALFYVVKQKKRGNKCVGCLYACNCKEKNCTKEK